MPKTFGERIWKRRRELGLTQKELAYKLGVSAWTVLNWETGKTAPIDSDMAGVIAFLGTDPLPVSPTLAGRLRALRRANCWSIRRAAQEVGVDPNTWSGWEKGNPIVHRKHALIHALVNGKSID